MDNRARVVIKEVTPQTENGRFPIKRVVGQIVKVEADVFADGHDLLSALIRYRFKDEDKWTEVPMKMLGNDRWQGSFEVNKIGSYFYTITAWVDRFKTWRQDLAKRIDAGQKDIQINLAIGEQLLTGAIKRFPEAELQIRNWIKTLRNPDISLNEKTDLALSEDVFYLMEKYQERQFSVFYEKEVEIVVDPVKALFGSWYEVFPRSCSKEPGKHGTFKDCEDRLAYIAKMGFDVLYFPPIHPIGLTNRKGKNNSLKAEPGDPGTPWAIGSADGGHKAVNPQLGTLADFQSLLARAKNYGIEIALDLAFQCSPDHPYVNEHPKWFVLRPDGTIQYAENPPKKYQDIFPLNFESPEWCSLWEELKSIVTFWISQGIHIFRVDNPHTKSFYFWEWLISGIKKEYPETIFLAEAFTRPKVMYELAQIGFSQSYTYFAWRNTKSELTQYFTDLTKSEICEYFRPNLWPNTPDILTEYLQAGGRPAFLTRLVLAATLSASYGIYGPAFELCENTPKEPGSEEYLNSEKYEIKYWNTDRQDNLADFITRINRIRRENPALQNNSNLLFHKVDNDRLICYSKNTDDLSNIVLVVVNLDPQYTHSGWLDIPLENLGLDLKQPYQVHDLLSGARYLWYGSHNYVELDPRIVPAHIFQIRRRIRTERDFDYYL